MSILVVSVHADDGIFSCGEFVARQVADGQEVTVLSLCSTVPLHRAPADYAWQNRLSDEHEQACGTLGAKPRFAGFVDGKWLDDPRDVHADEQVLTEWFERHDAVLVPLGIHHPDHEHFAVASFRAAHQRQRLAVFEDLPYRVLYPEKAAALRAVFVQRFGAELESAANGGFLTQKLEACSLYESQWSPPEGDAPRCCSAPERIWWIR